MTEMALTFIILIVTTICFMIPKFRSDLVSLCSLLVLLLTGLVTPNEALAGFSNPVVLMLVGLFVVGEGVFQTGLAAQAGNRLVKIAGKGEAQLLMIVMVVVALLSGFLSNTGTVAVLMPIVVSLCVQLNISPGRMLIPLAFASSIGGVLTLIGTAPNLVASQALADAGYDRIQFFDFAPVGLVALAAGLLYMVYIGRRQLRRFVFDRASALQRGISAEELAGFYDLNGHFHRMAVPEGSPLVGKSLRELRLPVLYRLTVLEIERREQKSRAPLPLSIRREPAGPDSVVEAGDVVLLLGPPEEADRLADERGLRLTEASPRQRQAGEEHPSGLTMAEVLLTPFSGLINKTLEEADFRSKYGLSVLAMNRRGRYKLDQPTQEKLEYGDSLLVHGTWEKLRVLAKASGDVVVLRHSPEPENPAADPKRALTAGIILLGMLALMTLELVPAVIAVMMAGLVMVLTGCLRSTDDAYRSVHWRTIVLIAAILPLATALEKSGGVTFIAEGIVSLLGEIGPVAVLAGLYVITSLFSQFISNTATAVLFAPVAVTAAVNMGVHPLPFVMAVAVSASMAFATPVASPPNAMVMTAGNYSFGDFMRVGVPLQLVIGIVVVLVLPLLYPL
ncbi:SLC13 family permease [Paenibacillus tarimensis]